MEYYSCNLYLAFNVLTLVLLTLAWEIDSSSDPNTQELRFKDIIMARVKTMVAKSAIAGIVPKYNIAVQAARRISDRSIPDDLYNKIATFYSSLD